MRRYEPAGVTEIAEVIAAAVAAREPLGIEGHGTRVRWRAPVSAPACLSVRRLHGIQRYEPGELVMSARAGTPLAEVIAALAARGQHLAFDPTCPAQGTIGGAFLVNDGGPRRWVAGAARDHLLGFSAISGRGLSFKSGAAVIKNVTGYDLSKLVCGSLGSLAVVTELTFKALPAPLATATCVAPVSDTGAAVRQMIALSHLACTPAAIAYLPAAVLETPALRGCVPGGDGWVAARAEGSPVTVAEQLRQLRQAMAGAVELAPDRGQRLWATVRDVTPVFDDHPAAILLRISIPPSALAQLMAQVPEAGRLRWFADAAGGRVWLGIDATPADAVTAAVRAVVASLGGSVLAGAADPALRRAVGVFSPRPAAVAALAARLKSSFDPALILNPGVFGETGAG